MNKRGFSFVEIMIVIVIVGLLMGIALPNYINAKQKSKTLVCTSNQKIIYTAAEMYQMSEIDSLQSAGSDQARLNELISKGYLKSNKYFECPSSATRDYSDYRFIFNGGELVDIECLEKGSEHEWP